MSEPTPDRTEVTESTIEVDDEPGDPAATDTGDQAAVDPDEQTDTDEPDPNDDAGDDLGDVDEGQVVTDLSDDPDEGGC